MDDRVVIEGLVARTIVGIYPWEQRVRQLVRLDLEMGWDVRKAAQSDAIADALDYKAVAKRLVAFVESGRFQLIERIAEECARIVLVEFGAPWVRIKVSKPGAVTRAENVAVVIERRRG